jgi:hypothetical protein
MASLPLTWYADNVAWMTAIPFTFSFLLALQSTSFLTSDGLTIDEFEVTRGVGLYTRRKDEAQEGTAYPRASLARELRIA